VGRGGGGGGGSIFRVMTMNSRSMLATGGEAGGAAAKRQGGRTLGQILQDGRPLEQPTKGGLHQQAENYNSMVAVSLLEAVRCKQSGKTLLSQVNTKTAHGWDLDGRSSTCQKE